ncbi:DUF5801 repeats-in-toxin domain-containing protein [Pseudomonas asiatica]|uniref:DUF5801 repeats-in-toxin domain-containing protein n=1 Tax=Pseudomonas asiatica TaxID=2219225 RepID=UPI002570E76A|nr:DUF5801 repeats-in-toxin domain-containing protein [Pseudomonas asiatica]WJD71358.1 DUF5801 repeats-in-toxin domain-containing protein [Pseudomonas asiatica]
MTIRKKNASPTDKHSSPSGDDLPPISSPTVTTDLSDYSPGSTATITASGFAAGSTVAFEVDHVTDAGADKLWGTPDDVLATSSGEGHTPWYVTDGGADDLDGQVNGSITTSWYVNPDDSAGATFLLSATAAGADQVLGSADDVMATASFTDSAPIITATGVSVTLDETAALQNGTATTTPASDADDNDILVASLPSAFSTRLTTLGAGTPAGAALSGYTGAVGNTGSNAFSITPVPGGSITDISFTDSAGAPLNGLDSGLDTLNGVDILLYTDTNNNIVLGRAGGPTGAIIFAGYIEETGSPVSGGKIWTVEYQPLKHPNTGNPDDAVNLLNKVFIGTSQDLAFSLANAPSGQNLFLMFTTANPTVVNDGGILRITDPTIIATGKDPADQSSGANITTGDTINTSQAGGPTTFGTNNQMIVEQEGVRFTFVTGARQNVTIPNLDQNEADIEANVDFTAVFNARSATFDVVQLQSGKSAVVRLSAFSTAAEPGVNFVNGYANDATVAITNVRVINIATGQVIENSNGSVNDPSIVISFASGVATLTGIKAGQKIEYTTTQDHNRVLVENGAAVDAKGNEHADFDIGGFMLRQVSTATAEIGSKMSFEDDGPSISTTGTEPVLTVDETILATDATQSFAANFTSAFGADGAGTLTYTLGVVAGASGLTDTATGEAVNLSLNGTVVEGRTATTNLLVFTVSVASNGSVTLDQLRAIVHPDTSNPDDSKTLTSDNLVTLTATKTDKDGDSAQAILNIGQNLVFKDDGPSISTTGTEPVLTVDETDLTTNATQSFAANFTSAFGADGAGTLTYALGVVAGASGLTDTATGEAVNLSLNGTVVEGRTATTNLLVFTVSVASNGSVTLDQLRAIVHPDTSNPDDSKTLTSDNLVTLTATKTDKDGDSAQAILNIGQNLVFKDDGPSISTTGTEPVLTVDETDLTTNATQSFAANFTSAFGADGAGTLTYALGVVASASGLIDTATGSAVNLSLNGTIVEGRSAVGNHLVFTVSVASNGEVTLDQLRAVVHPDTNNPDDSKTLTSDDLVTLTATKTDKDGDSAQATLNIGQNLEFKDDGPSISTTGTEPVLTVDETDLTTDATQSFAANFPSAFGADGAGTLTYALGVVAGASGLTDTATGEAVNLSLNGTVVEGRTATTNLLVFTVSVASNGSVTLDQLRAIVHPDTSNPDDSKTLTADNLVTLTATKTDKDGDSAQATLNIGQNLVFHDDGPTLAFGNLIGTGSILPQYGFWNSTIGADGLGTTGLDISLVGGQFTLVRPDNTTTTGTGTLTETSPSPDANGAFHFTGTLTGDFDNNATTANTTIDYTLTAFANGSYTLDLVQGFSSVTTFSSADGSLDAGGPDAVRTLLIPKTNDPTIPSASEEIVFFSAKALASTADIFTGIGLGAPDPTEASLQTNPLPSYIDPAAMNVSTSGIGVANNLLQGDNLAAISAADESFVINPETLLTGMKIFIDNSVAGYNTATEDLYYRIYYADGTTSNLTEVNTLTPEAGGQVSFLVQKEGSALIDAVQLTMGRGDIKIPVIEFIKETENLASDVKLQFSATLTDKDGDSASSTFDANLFANEPDNAPFDFTLVGTTGERDAFNIDLSTDELLYQVSGFDAGAGQRDTLVLNGDPNAVVQSIDNNGADSIVTIAESGGQTTTITLVGVDIVNNDIFNGSA